MEAQTAIDAKLVRLERRALGLLERIRKLKVQRNKHATVSKVPDEVLLEIFMVLMARFPVKEWHQIAHVCRHWRNVAVGAPMLWTNPSTDNYYLTMLMLQRSKDSGLTVCLGPETSLSTVRMLLKSIARIDSLEIEEPYDRLLQIDEEMKKQNKIMDALLASLHQEAACPKSVKIFDPKSIYNWFDSRPILRLLRQLNSLRKLHLKHTYLSWDSLPVNNLTHLWLQDTQFASPIPIQQFIDTLPRMPLLESLSLPFSLETLSSPPTSTTSQGKTIILPCLRQLDLTECDPNHISYFMAHTSFPRLRRMDLHLGFSTTYSDHHPNILHAIAHAVAGGEFGTFESITVELVPYNGYSLSMSGIIYERPREDHDLWLTNAPPYIGLFFPNTGHRDVGLRLCAQFPLDISELSGVNCSGYIHLGIDALCGFTEEEFTQLLGRPSYLFLQTITITNALSCITTLVTVLAPQHPSKPPVVPFPHLKSVSFKWTDFATSQESLLEDFCDCLVLRRQNGSPLHELVLRNCRVSSSQQTRLVQAVVNLEFR